MKMPALQFYPGDWRKDPSVQSLGYFDRGVWFEMLCIMHESNERGVLILNGKPMPEEALARLLGLDNQILTNTLTTLLTYGVAKKREADGAIYSKRMVNDEHLCQIRREAGKKGGNPVLLNQNTTTEDNQIPTPSSSSSSSSSDINHKNKTSAKPQIRIPYDEIVDLYHKLLPLNPQIYDLTAKRKDAIAARWKSGRLPDLESWEKYFTYVSESKFLTGQVDPPPGRKRFFAKIEWLANENNIVNVAEGKYHGS